MLGYLQSLGKFPGQQPSAAPTIPSAGAITPGMFPGWQPSPAPYRWPQGQGDFLPGGPYG
jgi:hypothetical protein